MSHCHGKSYCKSEDEIREFVDNHVIYILYNDQRYNPNIYNDERIIEKTLNFDSFPLFFETQDIIINSIQKQHLESEANL